MSIKEQIERLGPVGPDGEYLYQLPEIKATFIPPENPLERYLFSQLEAAFSRYGDRVSITKEGKFPQEVNVAFAFTTDLDKEVRPRKFYGRHQKPRNHKKAITIGVIKELDATILNNPEALFKWARGILVKKGSHNAIIIEGDLQKSTLNEGARAIIVSMEGNIGMETFDGDGQEFFDHLVERLKLLCGAEMINIKEGQEVTAPTFEDWCNRRVVQEVAEASHFLGEHGLLWDLELREFAGFRQTEMILRTLKQAGLGEGNLSAIDRELKVMAITETGVSKTHINPAKGEVVAVPGITENGTVHWVMWGLPEGHPITLYRDHSRESLKAVGEFLISAWRRGKTRQVLKDIFTKINKIRIDHPSSIEASENARFFMAHALLTAGRIDNFKDLLTYLADGFCHSRILPIIPEGVEPAADAAIHVHKTPKLKQKDPQIKIVDPNIKKLGFRHSPNCGSWEGAVLPLMALFLSDEEFGSPESEEEIRGAVLLGHGSYFWGYKGIKYLAEAVVERVEFEDYVPWL